MDKMTLCIKKLFKPMTLISSISVMSILSANYANADAPQWQFVDEFKDFIVITEPTDKVIGHRPGVETFALVKNGLTGQPDQLEMCDTVKITYRILDKDADWADIATIADTVKWFVFKVPTGQSIPEQIQDEDKYFLVSNDSINDTDIPFDLRYRDFEDTQLSPDEQNLSLRLLDHIKLRNAASGKLEAKKLKAFINSANKDDYKIYLGYELWPHTEIGEPYQSSKITVVKQFKSVTRLSPELEIGEEQLISETTDISSIVQEYGLGERFMNYTAVSSNEINADTASCVLPPPIKNSPYLIGYYLVQEEIDDTEPVDYLVAGEKYIVQFFYDKNKNRFIDNEDENLTQELLADGAMDYIERPFINGLRLDLAFNSNGVNLNAYEDTENPNNNSVFINPVIVDDTGIVNENLKDPDTAVEGRGIPLDRFRNEFLTGGMHFFWIENDTSTTRNLYFETVEGIRIPEELLDTANVPKVLPDHFKSNIDNAITLQQFIINVKSSYPKGYEDYEENPDANDIQGGVE
ncbi:hypothetical protein [Thorsellia anophelis]|uniref:Uncharacterized protein n=1 Tax=Thorsellia anophelis DSM 18579 TaxID=1123402 RepID=A0A1I0AM03_9GAMM|nr:hypothetical protein [Thorsellia anophelis]SES95324.1 hypothetical protein SAMN02583745_00973 [Thorsellia anophelis DSM 18579]